ncbi:antitoxin [Adlercreutzia sp. ZJ138]|uniref:antitoxin n=1 Tax=Adlercreutzia sp. ZJ138 TaxID=2709405 RepID=UPI0013EC2D0B|nr:antitoxin [Adlercreutzia sp. ZJ138]
MMPQLSLYLDDSAMELLRERAVGSGQSLSKYVVNLIRHDEVNPAWPRGYWEDVYGSLNDLTFGAPDEVDVPLDDIVLFE